MEGKMDPQKIVNFTFNEGAEKKRKSYNPLLVIVIAYLALCLAAGLCRLVLGVMP